jgi:hypothetical protein
MSGPSPLLVFLLLVGSSPPNVPCSNESENGFEGTREVSQWGLKLVYAYVQVVEGGEVCATMLESRVHKFIHTQRSQQNAHTHTKTCHLY